MPTLTSILETGRRALIANRENLGVVGHNVSNVNTEGYSRQKAVQSATIPMDNINYGQIGTGVEISEITRSRNRLLDVQVRRENSTLGYWDKRNLMLQEVENVFNEPSDTGLSNVLADFWDAWGDLANDPESSSARSVLRQRTVVLNNMLNKYDLDLRSLQEQMNAEVEILIDEINSLSRQIADLNLQIRGEEAIGQNANDLRDKRDLAIDKLSQIVDIQYKEGDDGMMNVYIGGDILLQEGETRQLTTRLSSIHDVVISEVVWTDNFNPIESTSGKLQGMMGVRDTEIENIRSRFDELALTLVDEVNELHYDGYGLNGSTGIYFFDENTSGAGDIQLSSAVQSNINNIAAAATNAPGDNSNALEIAALADKLLLNNGNETFADYHANTMAEIGSLKQNADALYNQSDAVSTQLKNSRQSVQGVVLDEEMTDLIKFQQSYNAAANVISVVNELMNTVLNLTR